MQHLAETPTTRAVSASVGAVAPPRSSLRLRAVLAAALLAAALACGDEPPDRLDAARAALNDAFARRDVTALRRALAELRRVPGRTPEEIYAVAGLMMQAGETAEALWLLEAGVARHPERDELRVRLASAALVVDDPVRALAALDGIEPGSEQHLAALMLRARSQLELGDLPAALALFEAAERQYPASPQAVLARVATLLQEGRVDEARSALAEARRVAAEPERARELDTLVAELEFARGDREAGLARMRQLVADAPQDLAARLDLVRSLQAADRLDEAAEVARAGLALDPEQPVLQSLVAWVATLQGRPEEAEAVLRRMAEQMDSPSAHLVLARFVASTDPAAAAEILGRAAEAHPEAIMLRMHESEAWLDAGDVERARSALEVYRLRAPEDPHVGYLEARLALEAGDAAGAVRELRRVVSDLDRAYTQYWLARALEADGDEAGAERRYALALQRDRGHPAPAVALIRLAERSGNWQAAATWSSQLVARAPARSEGYALLVTSLARSGAGGRAEAAARLFVQRFPDSVDAAALLAMSQRVQGKLDAADAVLDAAEARLGPSPEIDDERALTLGARGEIAAGIRSIERAIAQRPEEAHYRASLALLAYTAGDTDTGDAAVDAAMTLDPGDPGPLELRATYRAERRDWAGASADLERSLALRPREARLHFLRGAVCEKQGRTSDAVAAYRRAIELDGGAFAAHNNLALLLLAEGDVDGAVRAASRAYALAGDDPQVLATLGAVYLRRGLAARATALLERALARNPDSAEAQRLLALAARASDRPLAAEAAPAAAAAAAADRPPTSPEVEAGGSAGSPRRNVALVVVDTLRPDWTTPYGDMQGTTPELARWAAHGVVFERVLAQSSWTKVSVASLMTSLWPADHGVRDVRDALGDDARTLAEELQAAGHATYGVQSNGWLAATFGFQQGFDRYVFPRGSPVAWMKNRAWPHADNVYLEVERLLDSHDPAQPFFLYVHLMDVHEYAAPAGFQRFGTDDAGAYRAAMRWTDHVLERLRKKLDALGLLDRTVLVLASDHGETFGEDGHHGHARNARAPVLRVPLVLRLPEATGPVRVRAQVRNLDIAPTLLELAGVGIPESFEGRSLVPLMRDPENRATDRVAYASLPARLYRDAVLQEAVSDGRWSLVRNLDPSRRELLFDLAVDPDAQVDLSGIEPEAALRLRPLLDAYERRTPTPGAVRSDIRIDPHIAEKLRAVGYLQ